VCVFVCVCVWVGGCGWACVSGVLHGVLHLGCSPCVASVQSSLLSTRGRPPPSGLAIEDQLAHPTLP
jgi:hypothetical protein